MTAVKKNINKRAIKILLSTNALILLSGAMLGPIYAIFVERVGGDLMDASLAGGAFALTAGVTTLISGKFSDKIKENELVIVLGYTIVGVGFLVYLWVNSVYTMFIVQAVIGLGEAIYSPAFDGAYSKHIDRKHLASQWGAWESMNYFTTAIGAVIGGLIVTTFGFEILFIVIGILCLASAFYILLLKRNVL